MEYSGNEIAIIGMSIKFPGSNSKEEFWDNLINARESITDVSDEELFRAGFTEEEISHPRFVKRASYCDGYDQFDAAFFGYSTKEAKLMDPQQRLFLENCWNALLDSGYRPKELDCKVGVFGSAGYNTYLVNCLEQDNDYIKKNGHYDVLVGNDKDYLATRVSYKLGLTGPGVTVQCACSSALVGIHLGCQSLLLGESDMCLAGGACVSVPVKKGYLYENGLITSNDGHCRAYDDESSGTVFGSGVGVIVLKRLEDAMADGDQIISVIKSTAINNDGQDRIGYTAPSEEGQAQVTRCALELEEIDPKTIRYIEGHGTGTELGDPIEINSIRAVFDLNSSELNSKHRCAIGSVKSNIGHLDVAAGIAGVVKASLCLYHKKIVPSLYFKSLNSKVSLDGTRFYIAQEVEDIEESEEPVRAAVNGFGVGGTNVSIILEEPPKRFEGKAIGTDYLVKVSAKTEKSLELMCQDVIQCLDRENFAQTAYTLDTRRSDYPVRSFLVVHKEKGKCGEIVYRTDGTVDNEIQKKVRICDQIQLRQIKDLCTQWDLFKNEFTRDIELAGDRYNLSINAIMDDNDTLADPILSWIARYSFVKVLKDKVNDFDRVCWSSSSDILRRAIHENWDILKLLEQVEEKEAQKLEDVQEANDYLIEFSQKGALAFWGIQWLNGNEVRFEELFHEQERVIVSAPGYHFEPKRYWFKETSSEYLWKKRLIQTENMKQVKDEDALTILLGEENTFTQQMYEELQSYGSGTVLRNTSLTSKERTQENKWNEVFTGWQKEGLLKDVKSVYVVIAWNIGRSSNQYEELIADYFYSIAKLSTVLQDVFQTAKKIKLYILQDDSDMEDKYASLKALSAGFCFTVTMEYLKIKAKNIWLSEPKEAAVREAIVREVYGNVKDIEVKLTGEKRYIVDYVKDTADSQESLLEENGVYIITGGTGNVGLLMAREIAKQHKSHLYLLGSRSLEEIGRQNKERADAVQAIMEQIRDLGSTVELIKADVADYEQVSESFDAILERNGYITGIIHGAGKTGKARDFIKDLTFEDTLDYCKAKVSGMYQISKWLTGKMVSFCLLVSSNVSVLGGQGDSIYSGANAVLNDFAEHREPAENTKWIAATFDYLPRIFTDQAVEDTEIAITGLLANAISEREFSDIFSAILSRESSGTVVISRSDLAERYDKTEMCGISELAKPEANEADNGPTNSDKFTRESVQRKIEEIWMNVLGDDDIDDSNFFELGGDSYGSISLATMLSETFELEIPVTYVYEYSSIPMMVDDIYEQLSSREQEEDKEEVIREQEESDKIVIVGLEGKFPGADNLEELWNNLLEGKCSITRFDKDAELSDLNAQDDGKGNRLVNARGIISDVDKFDYRFFGITKIEAELIDPQQRLFLEYCWKALEDAGFIPDQIDARVGVFASQGISTYLVNNLLKSGRILTDYSNVAIVNNSPDSLATRVSYKLNLKGPSKTIQTFCSSSLVALEDAVDNIKLGKCDMAIAGGVNIVVPQRSGYIYSEGCIFTPDAQVHPFDDTANGTIFSNGIGVVVVTTEKFAKENHLNIYGEICAVSINNDGAQKASYMSPSVKGQVECISNAYKESGINPEEVVHIEAHGTGTKLGDPIEVHALTSAFSQFTSKTEFCALGSVKGNLGHLDRAAGVTSLIKSCLILKNRLIPPLAYFKNANRNIDFHKTPFYVAQEAVEINTSQKAVVGVCALGVGGTNVFTLLKEYQNEDVENSKRTEYLFPFSAKCEESLYGYLKEFKKFLEYSNADLESISYTLQMARKEFDTRIMLLASSKEQLMIQIENLLTKKWNKINQKKITVVLPDQVEQFQDIIEELNAWQLEEGDLQVQLKNKRNAEKIRILKECLKSFIQNVTESSIDIAYVSEQEAKQADLGEVITLDCVSACYRIIQLVWENGQTVKWDVFNQGIHLNKVHIPTYCFRKTRCYVDPEEKGSTIPSNKETGIAALSSSIAAYEQIALKELEDLENVLKNRKE